MLMKEKAPPTTAKPEAPATPSTDNSHPVTPADDPVANGPRLQNHAPGGLTVSLGEDADEHEEKAPGAEAPSQARSRVGTKRGDWAADALPEHDPARDPERTVLDR